MDPVPVKKDFSIQQLSLVCIMLVIFLHAYTEPPQGTLSYYIQYGISYGICRIAVPVMFTISGYLFFLHFRVTFTGFMQKLKRRFFSLVIPFLLWSILGVIIYYVLQSLPGSEKHFTNTKTIVSLQPGELIRLILFDPPAYQLWYLQDLIVLTCLTPLIYYAVKYGRWIFPMLLFICWFPGINIPYLFISTEATFFFVLGSYLAIHPPAINHKWLGRLFPYLISIWILIIIVKTIHPPDQVRISIMLHRFSILAGAVSLWYLASTKKSGITEKLSGYAFFIYLSHEPLLTIIKKIPGLFVASYTGDNLGCYFLSAVITLSCCITAGLLLKRYLPAFYALLTGNR